MSRKTAFKIAVTELKNSGLTYSQVGDIVGLCKSRVYQIYKGKSGGTGPTKENRKEYVRKYVLKINGKFRLVNKRNRPDDICEICGKDKVNRLNYHHWDDDHPEHGVWVCGSCHAGCKFVEEEFHDKYIRLKVSIKLELEQV